MKSILVIPESALNQASIINLAKICMIYKRDDIAIGFAFDDDENQANWAFDDKTARDKMFDRILHQISENSVTTIQ